MPYLTLFTIYSKFLLRSSAYTRKNRSKCSYVLSLIFLPFSIYSDIVRIFWSALFKILSRSISSRSTDTVQDEFQITPKVITLIHWFNVEYWIQFVNTSRWN